MASSVRPACERTDAALRSRGLLFGLRKPLLETVVQKIAEQVMQLESLRMALGSRDKQLAAVKPVEQLSRICRTGDLVRQAHGYLGQQVERQQHVLVGTRHRVEIKSAEHRVERGRAIERIAETAPLGEKHEPYGPAARSIDIDVSGAAFRAQRNQTARLLIGKLQRGLGDHRQGAGEAHMAEFVSWQLSRQAHAAQRGRKFAEHHGENAAKRRHVGGVNVVENQQRLGLELGKVGTKEQASEFARRVGILHAEYRHA